MLALLLLGAAPALAHMRARRLRAAALAPVAALAFAAVAQLAFTRGWIVAASPIRCSRWSLSTLGTMSAGFVIERRERARVAEHNDVLEQRVRERTAELRDTQLEVVRRLGQAVESRDGDTGEHIERMSRLCHQLALRDRAAARTRPS